MHEQLGVYRLAAKQADRQAAYIALSSMYSSLHTILPSLIYPFEVNAIQLNLRSSKSLPPPTRLE